MDREQKLRTLAARQYAMVSSAQAREAGASWESLRARAESRNWSRVTRRVIRLVGAPSHALEPLMAAVLDGGPGTVVTRRSAAWLWEVPGFAPGPVEVARQRGAGSRAPSGARLYPLRYLPPHLITEVHGIPVVALPLLLFQLAGSERPARAERALDTICARSPAVHVRLAQLLPELAERGRNGIVLMREWLERNPPGSRVVESGLERRFERILREAGQEPLSRQIDAGGHEWIGRVDFVDRTLGALFEVDSSAHHASELDRAHDAARDADLLAAGWRSVTRIPEEWIWYEPARAVGAVRDARRRLRRQHDRSGT